MISENLARSLAKICGDGCMNEKYIRYNNTSQVLLDEFEEDIKKEFGDVHFTHGKVNSGTSFVQLHDKKIISVFFSHLPSFKSSDIFIPDSVKRSPLNVQIAFIRTFYDDEGCSAFRFNKSTQEWKRNLTLTSNSLRILCEIQQILSSLGITSNKMRRNNRQSNYDITFSLGITGKVNFLVFREKIGFKHPKKALLLDLIIDSYNATPKRNPTVCDEIKRKKWTCCSHF
jgi:intein/homing endonuclease